MCVFGVSRVRGNLILIVWVLIDKGCYNDVTTIADNYRLIDNSQWLIYNIRDNM